MEYNVVTSRQGSLDMLEMKLDVHTGFVAINSHLLELKDDETEEVKYFLVKKMRGVKLVSGHNKYSYDENQLYISNNTCSKCLKEFSTV